jgi:hypothetical protein
LDFRIAPSDLVYLWEECRQCFYAKHRWEKPIGRRPRTPFPGVFGHIDQRTRDFYDGKGTGWVSPALPRGVLDCRKMVVRSAPVAAPGVAATGSLKGDTDCIVHFEDGSFGVIDFKTTDPDPEQLGRRRWDRQLAAYAYALEHPAVEEWAMAPVTATGLLCFHPGPMSAQIDKERGVATFLGFPATWVPVPRDEAAFLDLMGEVLAVLAAPEAPAASSGCSFCAYRSQIVAWAREERVAA